MTVQELIEQLEDFPKDMLVRICGDTFDGRFEQEVDYTDTIDRSNITDINPKFVAIYGKEEQRNNKHLWWHHSDYSRCYHL